MNIDPAGTRLLEARQVASPNCDARPPGCEISLVVIHGISLPPGHYGGPEIDQLFTNRLDAAAHPYFATLAGFRVSTHLLIRRDGELVQYVPFNLRAWHAGESRYDGCSACNDFSIGIELEGQDNEAYTDIQYRQLATVLQVLIKAFPRLSAERIAGHSDIAPGRKTDPGPAFDWDDLQQRLAALQSQQFA